MKKSRLRMTFLIALLAVMTVVAAVVWQFLPDLLTRRDAPSTADAIVVLAGDSDGSRVERAGQLFHSGLAPKMIISGGSIYRETAWATLIKKRALELGIPEDAIIIQDRSYTTWQDAKYSIEIVRQRGYRKVLIVTSAWHSARSWKMFNQQAPEITWLSCPVETSYPEPWWDDPNLVRAIASEVLKCFWSEN